MKCKSCDKLLNQFETSQKDKTTGEFKDLCNSCDKASQGALAELQDDSGIRYKDQDSQLFT